MKFSAIVLALALAAAAPTAAHAQNAAQAAAIAQGVVGLIFGVMNPTPQCGPHDAIPQPYRPSTPVYNPPRPAPAPYRSAELNDDDDDDQVQPAPRRPVHHPSAYSSQPQTRPYYDQDNSEQAAQARTSVEDESTQDSDSTDSGDVAEIPSQPASAYRQRAGQTATRPPSTGYDFAAGQQ